MSETTGRGRSATAGRRRTRSSSSTGASATCTGSARSRSRARWRGTEPTSARSCSARPRSRCRPRRPTRHDRPAQGERRHGSDHAAPSGYLERPRPSGLADVIDIILDKGLVIDAYVRVSLIGIEILTIDARIVIASVDTYLRFAEAVSRLDLARERRVQGLPELMEGMTEGGAKSKTKGALEGAKEKLGPRRRRRRRRRGRRTKPRTPQPQASSLVVLARRASRSSGDEDDRGPRLRRRAGGRARLEHRRGDGRPAGRRIATWRRS